MIAPKWIQTFCIMFLQILCTGAGLFGQKFLFAVPIQISTLKTRQVVLTGLASLVSAMILSHCLAPIQLYSWLLDNCTTYIGFLIGYFYFLYQSQHPKISRAKVDVWYGELAQTFQAIQSVELNIFGRRIALFKIAYGFLWAVLLYSEAFTLLKQEARKNLYFFGLFAFLSDLAAVLVSFLSLL